MEYIWNITGRCNLSCEYCWDRFKLENEMPTEAALILIDQLATEGCETIIFTGGEPLIRKDFFNIVSHASQKGIKNLKICTNGLLIKKRIHDLVDSAITEIHISLDDTINTKFRNNIDILKENIRLLVERVNLESCKIVLVSVLDMEAIERFENVVEFAESLGIKSSFQFPSLLKHRTLSEYAVSNYKEDKTREIIEKLNKLYSKYTGTLDFFSKFYIDKSQKFYLEGIKPQLCGAGKQFKVISPSGELWDCYHKKQRKSDDIDSCFSEQCLIWTRSDNRAKRIINLINAKQG